MTAQHVKMKMNSSNCDGGRRRRWYSTEAFCPDAAITSEASPLQTDARNITHDRELRHSTTQANYATFSAAQSHGSSGLLLKPSQLSPFGWNILSSGSNTAASFRAPSTSRLCKTTHFFWCDRRDLQKRTNYHSFNVFHETRTNDTDRLLHCKLPTSTPFGCSWIALTLILGGLLVAYREVPFSRRDPFDSQCQSDWDHNIYIPLSGLDSSSSPSNSRTNIAQKQAFLVAQLAGSSKGLGALTDITSRPNRAYARQHGMDYVRFSVWQSSSYLLEKTCFDKVILLNTILDEQERQSEEQNGARSSMLFPNLFSVPSHLEYDAIAILPPDAIITNLDCNVFDLLPKDKLVAIAGWQYSEDSNTEEVTYTGRKNAFASKTDIIFINLRHPYASVVTKLWWDWVEPPEVSCGAGNDLTLLVDAISAVLREHETLDSVIAPLRENHKGFVCSAAKSESGSMGINGAQSKNNEKVIKGIAPSLPESRAHMLLDDFANIRVSLQTTADSVCYRYYPRCEVL